MEIHKGSAVVDISNTRAFVSIIGFDGTVAMFDLSMLESMVDFLKLLKKQGFEQVEVGLEDDRGMVIFLDKPWTYFSIININHDSI